jgi:Fe-S-cluster containining protein
LPHKQTQMPETNLATIALSSLQNEAENDDFRRFIKDMDGAGLDAMAHEANDQISVAIDCTQCGNCCNKLVINVEPEDAVSCAKGLGLPTHDFIEKYIEVSEGGKYFVNTIPCHFLAEKKCTIYEHRFTDCREFPHLHKPGFKERLLGTLLHYGNCPIIYNVVEEMKVKTGFKA